jgi:hypothetical protein
LRDAEYSGQNLWGPSRDFEFGVGDLMGHVVGHIFFRLVENIEGISTIEEF